MKKIDLKPTDTLILEFQNLRIKKAERGDIENKVFQKSGCKCIVTDKECEVTILKPEIKKDKKGEK